MSDSRLWVLGAADTEMAAIENLLASIDEQVAYAIGPNGEHVNSGNAYRTIGFQYPGDPDFFECFNGEIITIECSSGRQKRVAHTIDHHHLGDPGYGLPPYRFLEGSSIGQVVSLMSRLGLIPWEKHRRHDYAIDTGSLSYGEPGGWEVVTDGHRQPEGSHYWASLIPQEIVFTASADHCLGAAYRGECPGVEPEDLMQWRVESRAAFQCRSVQDVLADVSAAREALRRAPEVTLNGFLTAKDLRGQHVPELPEASARESTCFVATGLRGRDGRTKIVCQSGSPAQILAFMEEWAPKQGIIGIYGDPERGFAGGYLS